MPPESGQNAPPKFAADSVSRETLGRLKDYQALLEKWQTKINLISPATLPDAWARHFEDSLQLLPLIPIDAQTLYDLGCGAGFPGLVLATARPDLTVTLIESDSKKCAFLQTVSRETNTPVFVHNHRIEKAAASLPPPDLITARALARLTDLLDLCAPWIAANPALTLIFPKGVRADEEVAEARENWKFELLAQPSQTENGAKILILTAVSKA